MTDADALKLRRVTFMPWMTRQSLDTGIPLTAWHVIYQDANYLQALALSGRDMT